MEALGVRGGIAMYQGEHESSIPSSATVINAAAYKLQILSCGNYNTLNVSE
jgi:hypothetical protein